MSDKERNLWAVAQSAYDLSRTSLREAQPQWNDVEPEKQQQWFEQAARWWEAFGEQASILWHDGSNAPWPD